MSDKHPDKLSQQIDAGVKNAIPKGSASQRANAIERHRRLGESISILVNGKVVTLRADQIPCLTNHKPSVQ